VWPDYGFDEWFLLCGVYPRAAYDGVLTFVPSDATSRLLPLDVQYAAKANERSEIHYFGSTGVGCCGPLEGGLPGTAQGRVRVRPDCTVLLGGALERLGKRGSPLVFEEPAPVVVSLKGELMEAMDRIASNGHTNWLAVLADGMVPGAQGAEVFLDRCLDGCDLAHSGFVFTLVTPEIEAWAKGKRLPTGHWKAGQPLKHPKLSGPMTLWRKSYLKQQLQAWHPERSTIPFEVWIAAQADSCPAVFIDTSPTSQGWAALELPPLSTLGRA
jgi:hypothetical protein